MNSFRRLCLYFLLVMPCAAGGQNIRQAIEAGSALQFEWVRQYITEAVDRSYPLYPDQFTSGDWEVRIGLEFSKGSDREVKGNVTYISYLFFPPADSLRIAPPEPVIVDTRFQDEYKGPLLLHFNEMTGLAFSATCAPEDYLAWLKAARQSLERQLADTHREASARQKIAATSLPDALDSEALAEVMCTILEHQLPVDEVFRPITINKPKEPVADHFRIDQPAKKCVLHGQIAGQVSPEVRIQYFRQENWFDFWKDTVLQLDPDGRFSLDFYLDEPQTVSVYHAYQTMRFYFRPGDSLGLRTDANAFYRLMKLSGTAVANQQFLLDLYHDLRGDTLYRSYDFHLLDKGQSAFLAEMLHKEGRELRFLHHRKAVLSPDFFSYMDRYIRFYYAEMIWEAATRFYKAPGMSLLAQLAQAAETRKSLLYRLPPQRTFDFSPEGYFSFQFARLQSLGIQIQASYASHLHFRHLLFSDEIVLRYYGIVFFRSYSRRNGLPPEQLLILEQLLALCRDSAVSRAFSLFSRPGAGSDDPPFYIPNIIPGKPAPDWSLEDREGVKVSLADLRGKKVLLHIGWVQNLASALEDVAFFQQGQTESPVVVHLLATDQSSHFEQATGNRAGWYFYVPMKQMEILRDSYRIENLSNHYFLLDERGMVVANNNDLGTPTKMRGIWDKLKKTPTANAWTDEQQLRFWRVSGLLAAVLLLISLLYLWRRRRLEQQELRKRRLLELELKGIRAQMNPHFLFNAMGSIQNLMRTNKQEQADLYLSRFAGLMRRILRNSAEEFIPLSEELDTLRQYCSLEALRHPFDFELDIAPEIDQHNTYVPAMILQPLVENAILHGLLPKQGSRNLLIQIKPDALGLACRILDNGIGVVAASVQKQSGAGSHKSYGIRLVNQRLALLGSREAGGVEITDRSTSSSEQSGTEVTFIIPVER